MFKVYRLQLIAIVALLPFTTIIHAQSSVTDSKITNDLHTASITGVITDDTKQPVPYASLILKNKSDSSLVKTTFTNNTGVFEFNKIKTGTYFIEIKMIGFEPFYKDGLTISIKENMISLGSLKLSPAIKLLNNVTITGQKPFIERRADKIVINLNQAITAGSSVSEVLDKLPGVRVSADGQVTLDGRIVQIFINGNAMPLSADALSGLLKGMAAANVEKIELIANPSAKYDANGGGGIINIIKSRNKNEGISGNVLAAAGQGTYGKQNTNLTLNYKFKAFNILLNPGYSFNKSFNDSRISSFFFNEQQPTTGEFSPVSNSTSLSVINSTRENRSYTPNAGVDILLSDRTTLSLSAAKDIQQINRSVLSATQLFDELKQLTDNNQFTNHIKTRIDNFNSGMHLQHKIDTSGREYTIDFDYFNNITESRENYKLETFNSQNLSYSLFDQDRRFNLYSVKANYTYPLKKAAQLEFGWKSSYVISKNVNSFFNIADDISTIDPSRNDNFRYQENINSLYAVYNKTAGKLSYNLGLRTENTWGKGEQIYTGEVFLKRYLQLFPSAFLAYKFNSSHGLNITARKYIDRPAYENLNPLIRIINSNNYTQGNPDLSPSTGYNLSATHSFKSALFTTIHYSRLSNSLTFIALPHGNEGVITTKPLNNKYTQDLSLQVNFNKQVKPWWYTSSGINFSQVTSKGTFEGSNLNNYGTINFTSATYHSVNITKTFTFLLLFRYIGKSEQNNIIADPYITVSTGLMKSFFNKKANLTFHLTDVFNSYRNNYSRNSIAVNQSYINNYETRVGKLSFNYSFGGKIKNTKNGNSADDEKKRTTTQEN